MRTPSGERKATNGTLTQTPGPGLENTHKETVSLQAKT